MSTLTKPYSFAAGTNAVASQVNADFDALFNWVNGGGAMWADASVAFTGIPILPASDPTSDNQAVRRRTVANMVQPTAGFVGGTPPAGTLFKIQGASTVSTIDSFGNQSITFPTPFSSGVLTIVAINGDANIGPHSILECGGLGLASAVFRWWNVVGPTTYGAGASVRCNWIAIGW